MKEPRLLFDILRERAETQPDSVAYLFSDDGVAAQDVLTYGALYARARAVASHITLHVPRGSAVLLLYPAGLDYVVAFFACLGAGVMATPAYPPDPKRLDRGIARLVHMVRHAGVELILGPAATHDALQRSDAAAAFSGTRWLATDTCQTVEGAFLREAVDIEDIAFLQYTSGSTACPKGVAVRHRNLWHNLDLCQSFDPAGTSARAMTWLPAYHDMGLIEGLLRPLFGGYPTWVMPPQAFLHDPLGWLRAIGRHSITSSGAPNFAYDLCVRRAREADLSGLDLSTWCLAYNSAEPVRADTLEAFARTFAPCGFDKQAMHPGYGLAENTLVVCGHRRDRPYRVLHVDAGALRRDVVVSVPAGGDAVPLVSCGMPCEQTHVQIMRATTGTRVKSDEVGEIWVQSPSVAAGYHRAPEDSSTTFTAASAEGGTWLRTGDLGFLHAGLLYLTGRLKDVIIVRGVKHYPQDLEATAVAAHANLRAGGAVCFGVQRRTQELLVVLAELRRDVALTSTAADALRRTVRSAIAVAHGVGMAEVVLVASGALIKTTSGKPCRSACRAAYLAGELPQADVCASGDLPGHARHDQVLEYLLARIRGECTEGLPAYLCESTMDACGFGSLSRVELCLRLGDVLGCDVAPHALGGMATLAQIADGLLAGGEVSAHAADQATMLRDAACPIPGLAGPRTQALPKERILVTGATGFVGHHVVFELLRRGWSQVVCLSRGPDAMATLRNKMASLPGWEPEMAARVAVVRGDITQARLGCEAYDRLAQDIDTVLHAAAEVGWTDDYEACRAGHVAGTRHVLDFAASGRRKHVVYISSMAVLHWVDRQGNAIDETTESFAHREALDWGYAQAKCVAERLVSRAQGAGLQTHIVRPDLVWGHSDTGMANTNDIIAAMVRGCIHMRAAPDMDWRIEACPVDALAQAVAALCGDPGAATSPGTHPEAPSHLHVAHPQGRHWRELILWLNLHGYLVRLVPYPEWCALLRSNADAATQRLRALLPFFTRRAGNTDASLPEWYITTRRPARRQGISEAWLDAQGIRVPPLSDAYMAKVTAGYVAQNWLTRAPRASHASKANGSGSGLARDEDLLREAVHGIHPQARIDRVEPFAATIADSITIQATSVGHGESAALRPYRLHGSFPDAAGGERPSIEVMFKRKPHADAIFEVVRRIAALAHPDTGVQIARAQEQLDVANCHRREIGVYKCLHDHGAKYVPRLWGCLDAPERRVWLVVMGFATATRHPVPPWDTHLLPMAARAMAHLHAPWLQRQAHRQGQAFMGNRRAGSQKVTMVALWEALSRHLQATLQTYVPSARRDLPARILDWLLPRWHGLDALPQTLVHNDFSLRNSIVVDGIRGPELCIYDWELAKIGPPQQDLVSYLCLGPEPVAPTAITGAIEAHRLHLMEATGQPMDPPTWMDGLQLAMADFFVDRLATLAMLHRVAPVSALPQALRNWWRLAEMVGLPLH